MKRRFTEEQIMGFCESRRPVVKSRRSSGGTGSRSRCFTVGRRSTVARPH